MKYDLTNKRFGKLRVVKHAYTKKNMNWWECKCDCGETAIVNAGHLGSKKIISCGCYRRAYNSLQPYQWMYNSMARVSKRKNHSDIMSFEDFLTFTNIYKCYYCGYRIQWPQHQFYQNKLLPDVNGYNLDRKNNSVGYTKDNCIVGCSLCNMIKGRSLSYDEMCMLGKYVEEIHKKRAAEDNNPRLTPEH